jgi:hypothetical protein
MFIPLDPEILHGGIAQVRLPEPPYGYRWRIEWRVVETDDWHAAANKLPAGEHAVSDTETPEPQPRIEWRAVAVDAEADPTCSICGASGAVLQGYRDRDLGDVALCAAHRDREMDWT